MQFYQLSGIPDGCEWQPTERSSPRARRNDSSIMLKCSAFNDGTQDKPFFFFVEADDDEIIIGIICRDPANLRQHIADFLKATGIKLKNAVLSELTLDGVRRLLHISDRNCFTEDDSEVLERFELDGFVGRHAKFDLNEALIAKTDKDAVFSEAECSLAGQKLMSELERIYMGRKKERVAGHPVHYIISTDDGETRDKIVNLLLQALYSNDRLDSRRVSCVEMKPDDYVSDKCYEGLYKIDFGGSVVVNYRAEIKDENCYADSGRAVIETMCNAMRKYRNQVLTILCLPRECSAAKDIIFENLTNVSLVEISEDYIYGETACNYLKALAKKRDVRTDKKLFSALEEGKGYLAPELSELFDTWYDNKLRTGIYPQYKEFATVDREILKAKPKGTAYDELMEMIGLDNAKKVIRQALDYHKAQMLFASRGMQSEHMTMHMVFTGNPGTAKTSVARLVARILKENNILSKGQLIEVGRADLVGKYVGWTAPTIKQKFRAAEGGVLFIDEAYSLVDGSCSFGDEAINTIVQEMENHRDDVIVIFAGYPDEMETFLQKNPGLRSRIAWHVPFEDYTPDELCDIARLIAKQKGLTLSQSACDKLGGIFGDAVAVKDFGNGRFVRNTIEKAKMAQATRLISMDYDSIRQEDITTICAEDIEVPCLPHRPKKNRIGFCA